MQNVLLSPQLHKLYVHTHLAAQHLRKPRDTGLASLSVHAKCSLVPISLGAGRGSGRKISFSVCYGVTA